MRLLLPPALIVTTVLSADPGNHPSYERLLGKSHFANKTEIEKFILSLQELNKLQNAINGNPEVASDPSGQSFLDVVGNTEPVKPDLLPYLFEGDIILTEEQMNKTLHEKRIQALFKKIGRTPPVKRSLTSDTRVRWSFPVNYFIDTRTGVSYSAVKAGIEKWTELTCATFKESNSQPFGVPSLRFIRGEGCYSYIGRSSSSGSQEVSIGNGCTSLGTVTHEIGHALGFYHEQSRPERDDYVTVQTQNIQNAYQSQFTKQSYSSAINYGVEYDYGSVMHYDAYGFSAYGYPTITTKDANYQSTIGQRDEPSFADVKQINFAYCNITCAGSTLDCQNGGYPDPKNCAVCRCPPGLGGTACDEVQRSLSTEICGNTDLTATINMQQVSVSGDTDCYYRITAPPGRKVFLTFNTLTFPAYRTCAVSYAEVKYRANPAITGARFCGSNKAPVNSEGQTMFVIYKGASTSRLSFGYRFDPATPIDPTTTAGPGTVPTTSSTTSTTTTTASTTTTTTAEPTTTWPYWFTTTSPTSTCQWSACTANCGGCGKQTRRCNGRTETRYCATNPCRGGACCFPFTFIINGVCSKDEPDYEWHSETPEKPISNELPVDEPTTTPYVTSEQDKHTIHIQPPEFPLKIDLPDELFRPEEKTLTIDANKIGLRSPSATAAGPRPVPVARRVPMVEGSGEAPTTGEEGLEIAQNLDKDGLEVEGSGDVPVTVDKTYSEIDKSVKSAVTSEAEENRIVEEFKKKEEKKASSSKPKKNSSSQSSEEDVAGSSAHSRARRYVFPGAIPRIRLADDPRVVAAVATRRG